MYACSAMKDKHIICYSYRKGKVRQNIAMEHVYHTQNKGTNKHIGQFKLKSYIIM